eukprot:1574031-Pyramimonas_sp.AAC.1
MDPSIQLNIPRIRFPLLLPPPSVHAHNHNTVVEFSMATRCAYIRGHLRPGVILGAGGCLRAASRRSAHRGGLHRRGQQKAHVRERVRRRRAHGGAQGNDKFGMQDRANPTNLNEAATPPALQVENDPATVSYDKLRGCWGCYWGVKRWSTTRPLSLTTSCWRCFGHCTTRPRAPLSSTNPPSGRRRRSRGLNMNLYEYCGGGCGGDRRQGGEVGSADSDGGGGGAPTVLQGGVVPPELQGQEQGAVGTVCSVHRARVPAGGKRAVPAAGGSGMCAWKCRGTEVSSTSSLVALESPS